MTEVDKTVAWIERVGRPRVRESMARYGLPTEHAVGIPVGVLKQRAKVLGRDHDLARALWKRMPFRASGTRTSVIVDLIAVMLTSAWQRDAFCLGDDLG